MAWKIIATVGLIAGASAQALAQQGGPPAPAVPGSVDSTAAARNTREQQEGFNRIANEGVPITNADGKPQREKRKAGPVAAAEADFVVGAAVRDRNGVQIATLQSLEEDGAIVMAGDRLAKLPFDAFGKDDDGLLIGITGDEFQAAIATTSVPVPQESKIVDATALDMMPGAVVRDSEGVQIGTVDALLSDGVIVATEGRKVKLAMESFAKDDEGLLIGITASEFKAIIGGGSSSAPAGG